MGNYVTIATIELGEKATPTILCAVSELFDALNQEYTTSFAHGGDPFTDVVKNVIMETTSYDNTIVLKRHRTHEEMETEAVQETEREAAAERYDEKRKQRTAEVAAELGVTVEEFEAARKKASGY
jgi:hypothetical protein